MSKIENSGFAIRLPIILALAISAGIFIGARMFGAGGPPGKEVSGHANRLREILNYIDRYYVDSANTEELTEFAIVKILEKLDPHTNYIPARDVEVMGQQLNSYFEGIGVMFNIFRDTIFVESPVAGGPAEQAGVKAGDRIVKINDETVAGIGINTRGVYDRLLGKKGTKVTIGIVRSNETNVLDFTITRDKIPQHSLDVAYMMDEKTGYIRLSRFGANAYDEFREALEQLNKQGMKQLVFDLRENGGGYLDRAVNIADELLADKCLIVYTDGKAAHTDEKYYASKKGIYETGALIVLIDEASASASEIVAGALQDNDRALIVGRRSYGKGLVQRPITLSDGGELRLTVSRYYTPSGRSIQKPYVKGDLDNYAKDHIRRIEHGELYHADSNKFDEKQEYKTVNGRKVYGGGGIMPDVFIPADTSYSTPFLWKLLSEQILREYALGYATRHKEQLQKLGLEHFVKNFSTSDAMYAELIALAKANNIIPSGEEIHTSRRFIEQRIAALVARNIWREEGWYRVANMHDETVLKALQLFPEAKKISKQ